MYDLVIRGGRVIDPAQGIDAPRDVAFRDGKVAALEASIEAGAAREVIAAAGKLVVPGLIDLHTHVYWGGTSLSVQPVPVALRSGATTLVDAGSAGPGNFHGFRAHVIERTPVRILPYLNISFAGIFAFSKSVMVGECSDVRLLDARECLEVAERHRDLIVGIKVRVGRNTSEGYGVFPLELAIEVAQELGLPVMAHIDFPPPSRKDMLARLRPGDVLTHCYRPFPNAPVLRGEVRPEMWEARERGVIFDLGHGMGGFGFASTRPMLAAGFFPDVISSDVHILCEHGPAFDLLHTMSKLICLGMPLIEVIRAATARPAEALRRPDLGTLAVGAAGDATILNQAEGAFDYVDVMGERLQGDQRLEVEAIVLGGRPWPGNDTAG
ncbi:MAG TPA: amidohydrolase/deacetylase family metallohydrolase [Geminicoccaceae bacterium]|nr:amidohydrolase/deacetylase family metallohydrolase [Geminicoccaceae bacterium]